MGESWLIEIAKAIGKLFINPLTYWVILLIILAGIRRVRRERKNFGVKIVNVFSEWKGTWTISIVAGVILTGISVGVGIVFSYETFALLSLISIVLSLTLRFTLLSPSYTIGITSLLLLFIPTIIPYQSYISEELFQDINFVGIAVLLGLLLFVEAILTSRTNQEETYPDLIFGSRGKWIGLHHLKKISVIPFFTFVPTGLITPFADYWPYVSINGETYSLLLFPFILGFDHVVKGELPDKAAKTIGKKVTFLAIIVLLLAVGSYVYWPLSIVSAIVAIIGREFISFQHRVKDSQKPAFFNLNRRGVMVIAVIQNTPAQRIGIQIGEVISKVNGQAIQDVTEFYQALQRSGAFFKLEVIDTAGEARILQSAFYQNDHHELGLVFVKDRHRQNKNKESISPQ